MRKHLACVTIPSESHWRALVCLIASLVAHDRGLYITAFLPDDLVQKTRGVFAQFDLADASHRLRLVFIDASNPRDKSGGTARPSAGAAEAVIDNYFDALMAGHSIGEHEALPAPTGLLCDIFAYAVLDHAIDAGFQGELMLWSSIEAGALAWFEAVTAQALKSRAPALFEMPGIVSRWTNEWDCATHLMNTPIGTVSPRMIGLHICRIKGPRYIVGFSGKLLPRGPETLDRIFGSSAKNKTLSILAPYPPAFWQKGPPDFPKKDALFSWLERQDEKSVCLVTTGSWFFPQGQQFEVMVDALIASPWRFVFLLGAKSAANIAETVMAKMKKRIQDSGNIAQGWHDQQLILRHPAVGLIWHHGGVGSTLEALVFGHPAMVSPFLCDQIVHGGTIETTLDAGWQVWEGRDRLKGLDIASKPGFKVQATPQSLRRELDGILAAAAGEEGRRKRANAKRMGDLLRREYQENSKQYLDEFLALL